MVLTPRVRFHGIPSEAPEDERSHLAYTASTFVRERMARRYNADANRLLTAWISVLTGDKTCEIRALGVGDGVDGAFELSAVSAFARPGAPN